ncbi:MAG: hypothetical protein C0500_07185 [Sphingobium sp.]|nr:hypothetical protein [Sphingobium sp.]
MMRVRVALLLLAALAWTAAANAHLLPKQNATLHVIGDKGYLVVSVPVGALTGVDDDRDGLLDARELGRHSADIGRQFQARFRVASPDGPAPTELALVAHPGSDTGLSDPTRYVVVLASAQFAKPPASVTIETDLFGSAADERQITLRARRDSAAPADNAEVGVLDASNPQHQFFRGGWAIFGDFVQLGIEHILLGYDHLLFLLTVIIGASGWRYWLGVVTGFTVAHSITLTLAALGIVQVPAEIVEPLIALSIVGMGAFNLLRPGGDARWRVVLVMACGLLHGLGFASALGDMGLGTGNRIATLAGFNIGVEIGQFAFLAAVLGLGWVASKMLRRRTRASLPRLASALACVLAAVMLVLRVIPSLPSV